MAFGDYPAEYDAKIHGPYDPARYYGKRKLNFMFTIEILLKCIMPLHNHDHKPDKKIEMFCPFNLCSHLIFYLKLLSNQRNLADTPFSQVKVGEIGAWLSRRDKNPRALVAAVSRAWWRWNHKYVLPKRGGIAPFFQLVTASMAFFYVINYGKISKLLILLT